jgi:hypothetical protein
MGKYSKDLFNKIRGRFEPIEIGDEEGNVTNEPDNASFFNFKFSHAGKKLGSVTLTIDDDGLSVIYSRDIVSSADNEEKNSWYDFLKNLRYFSKKRMLTFDVRDITKPYLTKRDYKYLSKQKNSFTESRLYGNNKKSFQKLDNSKIVINHTKHLEDGATNQDRSRNIMSIFIENTGGERFKYPYRHLSGARAMARHVSEGGNPYDTMGRHILEMSEEMWKLRKFKNYLQKSNVMAESLSQYSDIVTERIKYLGNTIKKIHSKNNYEKYVSEFKTVESVTIPEDVQNNWIEELTIRQFNEELKDIFPYVYNLISEKNKVININPENILNDEDVIEHTNRKKLTDFIMDHFDKKYLNFLITETEIEDLVQQEYGERFIGPTKAFIKRINDLSEDLKLKLDN